MSSVSDFKENVPYFNKGVSASFQECLTLGKAVNDWVNAQFKFIINYLDRKDRLIDIEKAGAAPASLYSQLSEIFEMNCISENGAAFEALNPDTKNIDPKQRLKAIQTIAKSALELEIGTCTEMSAVGFVYCQNQGISAEYFIVSQHALLVLNRDPKSDQNAYRDWGSNAIVCDAWANKVYSPAQISTELEIYTGTAVNQCDRTVRACFRPYKENRDSFSLIAKTEIH